MINISKYIQSNRVIKTYLDNIELLKEYDEYQHFISRLNVTKKVQTDAKYFENIVNNLSECVGMSVNDVVKQLLDNDPKGFLKKICETNNPDIYRYLYLTHISDFYSICKRNKVVLDDELVKKLTELFTSDETIDFLCRLCKNKDLREKEGTWCSNGIGYVLFYFNHTKENKTKLEEAFYDVFDYYINQYNIDDRDSVYGLTHCLLHFSRFYTEDIYKNTFERIENLYDKSKDLIKNSFSSLGKIQRMNSDMIAELLVVYKMLVKYEDKYSADAYNELVRRIDNKYNIIASNEADDFTQLLKSNEHTNILFILYCRL
jgi:hypothetical protein